MFVNDVRVGLMLVSACASFLGGCSEPECCDPVFGPGLSDEDLIACAATDATMFGCGSGFPETQRDVGRVCVSGVGGYRVLEVRASGALIPETQTAAELELDLSVVLERRRNIPESQRDVECRAQLSGDFGDPLSEFVRIPTCSTLLPDPETGECICAGTIELTQSFRYEYSPERDEFSSNGFFFNGCFRDGEGFLRQEFPVTRNREVAVNLIFFD